MYELWVRDDRLHLNHVHLKHNRVSKSIATNPQSHKDNLRREQRDFFRETHVRIVSIPQSSGPRLQREWIGVSVRHLHVDLGQIGVQRRVFMKECVWG